MEELRRIEGSTAPKLPIRKKQRNQIRGRRGRCFSSHQYSILVGCFKTNRYPSREAISNIAKYIGLETTRVRTWFQNARTRGASEVGVVSITEDPQRVMAGLYNRNRSVPDDIKSSGATAGLSSADHDLDTETEEEAAGPTLISVPVILTRDMRRYPVTEVALSIHEMCAALICASASNLGSCASGWNIELTSQFPGLVNSVLLPDSNETILTGINERLSKTWPKPTRLPFRLRAAGPIACIIAFLLMIVATCTTAGFYYATTAQYSEAKLVVIFVCPVIALLSAFVAMVIVFVTVPSLIVQGGQNKRHAEAVFAAIDDFLIERQEDYSLCGCTLSVGKNVDRTLPIDSPAFGVWLELRYPPMAIHSTSDDEERWPVHSDCSSAADVKETGRSRQANSRDHLTEYPVLSGPGGGYVRVMVEEERFGEDAVGLLTVNDAEEDEEGIPLPLAIARPEPELPFCDVEIHQTSSRFHTFWKMALGKSKWAQRTHQITPCFITSLDGMSPFSQVYYHQSFKDITAVTLFPPEFKRPKSCETGIVLHSPKRTLFMGGPAPVVALWRDMLQAYIVQARFTKDSFERPCRRIALTVHQTTEDFKYVIVIIRTPDGQSILFKSAPHGVGFDGCARIDPFDVTGVGSVRVEVYSADLPEFISMTPLGSTLIDFDAIPEAEVQPLMFCNVTVDKFWAESPTTVPGVALHPAQIDVGGTVSVFKPNDELVLEGPLSDVGETLIDPNEVRRTSMEHRHGGRLGRGGDNADGDGADRAAADRRLPRDTAGVPLAAGPPGSAGRPRHVRRMSGRSPTAGHVDASE
ncbi:Homeobox domain [Carpediemonas membranifera]|uniref:Homeobox domain n=1 Tax=Carpediemonas membranifera TaxID=201153 RepID=A0A8J6AUC6_9EUKA|nr:Homeobox domain [Carpediemonas membranifera]|eukprot:KAG9391785.1 Homeobox domain [Carpediemonas membranifera]